ncbi:MAG TPA: cellulase family glycosylhydrolase [Chloroflexota bacterium]|nr:cellulase family glycosylhydrolase [Chloroflexota bacterium]
MLKRALPPLFAALSLMLTACQPGPPRPQTQAKPTSERTTSGGRAPTPVIASPIVQLVEGGRVASPSPAVHVFLWGNSETTDRDLKAAKDAGFTWVKQRFEWRFIEKSRKNSFEWQEPDRIVNAVNQAGLGMVARIDNQPDWARRDRIFPASGPPDKMEDWKDFVESLTERYKGKIQAYEVWNEPNISREWGNVQPDAAAYTEMLRITYTAIKKADPQAIVISAGLSPTTEISERARADTLFLNEMYQAGAKQYFDMLGVHAPGFKAAPETDPAEVARNPQLNNNDPSAEELRRAYSFRHAEDMRKIMVDNGDADKQVSIMEMGWTSDVRPNSPYLWHAVTEDEKAQYLTRAVQYAKSNWVPWIAHMSIIYIPDPNWGPSDEQYYWSIMNPDGTPRAAYDALKAVLPSLAPIPPAAPAGGASAAASPAASPAAKP